MVYNDLATINITLESGGIVGQGFGIALFASSHRYFPERVRSYLSLTDAAADLPTTSDAYKAVQGFFSATPSPEVVKVGRREADLDLVVASGSTTGSLTFSATDGTDTYTLSISATGADATAVATDIITEIESDSDIGPLVVATSVGGTVSITPATATDAFIVKNLSVNISEAYTTVETADNLITALEQEDSDFYIFTADDHTEAFVLAASAAIEARTKMYFFSVQEQSALTSYNSGAATDILGKIADESYLRTKGMFDDLADTEFPECEWVGHNILYPSGSITWANVKLTNSATKDPSTGFLLNITQKGYLEARNSAYLERIGSFNVIRNGRVAGNEHIDIIRGRDNLSSDLDVAYINLLTSQQGTKLPYNNEGIIALEATCEGILNKYVDRGFINPNFKISFPRIDKVSNADKAARVYQDGTFETEFVGAIEVVKAFGKLSLTI